MNPELRATLTRARHTLESANETTAETFYTFTQLVIDPCLGGIRGCFSDISTTCFPTHDERLRRKRARSRAGRGVEGGFGFYDDWLDEPEVADGQGWGNDELDSLLASSRRPGNTQPGRVRAMSYGSKGLRRPARERNEEERNIVPQSSYLGFLERFRWMRPGGRGVRYRPSAADLQENPGSSRLKQSRHGTRPLQDVNEDEDTLESSEDQEDIGRRKKKGHARQRSDTGASDASKSTTNSLSSRGDLIMSDEEPDAVPLDDEFAVMLSRQTTAGSAKRPGVSRKSTRTASSKSERSTNSRRSDSSRSLRPARIAPVLEQSEVQVRVKVPSMATLRAEEDDLRQEQEMEIEQKREAAHALADDLGLRRVQGEESVELKPEDDRPDEGSNEMAVRPQRPNLASPVSSHEYRADEETEPFPSFPTTPVREMGDDERES